MDSHFFINVHLAVDVKRRGIVCSSGLSTLAVFKNPHSLLPWPPPPSTFSELGMDFRGILLDPKRTNKKRPKYRL